MSIQMILCPVRCKVRDVMVVLHPKTDGSASVSLTFSLESLSDKLDRFALIVPATAERFEAQHEALLLTRGAVVSNAQSISVEMTRPLGLGEEKIVQLDFHWPRAINLELDAQGSVSRLMMNIKSYGTPFSSSLLPDLSELTEADILTLQVTPPEDCELEKATPPWRTIGGPAMEHGTAKWVFTHVGTHNPVKVELSLIDSRIAQTKAAEMAQFQSSARLYESKMTQMQSELEEERAKSASLEIDLTQASDLSRQGTLYRNNTILLILAAVILLLLVAIVIIVSSSQPPPIPTPTPTLTPPPTVTPTSSPTPLAAIGLWTAIVVQAYYAIG